ncbi:FAD-dependent oxidoreductase, partial [Streptomyces lanatus]
MIDVAEDFDLVVLGGGSAGYAAALRGAQLGLRTAMIERHRLGGTCLHNGCIPTKALLHAAEVADRTRDAQFFGVMATFESIDMPAVQRYKDKTVDSLCRGLTSLVKARDITYIEGEGRLSSPTSVDVNGRRVQGRHVLLATGSVPKSLPGLEIDGDR